MILKEKSPASWHSSHPLKKHLNLRDDQIHKIPGLVLETRRVTRDQVNMIRVQIFIIPDPAQS
jgi:hypothetical protein